jgi:hypothetical protein
VWKLSRWLVETHQSLAKVTATAGIHTLERVAMRLHQTGYCCSPRQLGMIEARYAERCYWSHYLWRINLPVPAAGPMVCWQESAAQAQTGLSSALPS